MAQEHHKRGGDKNISAREKGVECCVIFLPSETFPSRRRKEAHKTLEAKEAHQVTRSLGPSPRL